MGQIIAAIRRIGATDGAVVSKVAIIHRLTARGGRNSSVIMSKVGGLASRGNRLRSQATSSRRVAKSVGSRMRGITSVVGSVMSLATRSNGRTGADSISLRDLMRATEAVTSLSGRMRRVLSTFGTRFRAMGRRAKAVSDVSDRAGLLTLGTSVRTTHTKRTKGKFSIITRRVHGLDARAGSSSKRVDRTLSQLSRVSKGVASSVRRALGLVRIALRGMARANRGMGGVARSSSLLNRRVRAVSSTVGRIRSSGHRLMRGVRRMSSVIRAVAAYVDSSSRADGHVLDGCRRDTSGVGGVRGMVRRLVYRLNVNNFVNLSSVRTNVGTGIVLPGRLRHVRCRKRIESITRGDVSLVLSSGPRLGKSRAYGIRIAISGILCY